MRPVPMRKLFVIVFAAAVLAIVFGVTCATLRTSHPDALALGTFVVVSLTLLVLIWYAYGTNTIARVTEERWRREGTLTATYSMELVGEKGNVGRTLFRLHNLTSLGA